MAYIVLLLFGLLSFPASTTVSSLFSDRAPISDSQEVFAARTYFYTGGKFVKTSEMETFMTGQIYVERLEPRMVKKKHPLVFIHGAAQSGSVRILRIVRLLL